MTKPNTSERATQRLAIFLLVVAALCSYGNSLDKAFVLDDSIWITNDGAVARTSQWFGSTRPLLALSVQSNYRVGGLDPTGYHAFNILVHVLGGLALFGIVRLTLAGSTRWPHHQARATSLAFAVALLWLVHPLQTQSVTYVIQRSESMMGLFFLFALYGSIRSWDAWNPLVWQAAAVVSCMLGANCKEVIVAAPVLAALYDWTFRAESIGTLIRKRSLFYLALTAGTWSPMIFRWVREALQAPLGVPAPLPNAGFGYTGITPLSYLLTEAGVLLHYLRLSIWPVGLCLDYSGWPVASSVSDWLFPGLVIAALLAATVWGVIRRSWLGFVGAWFFVILAPTSSIMPIVDVAFEHRMYLSLASVILLVVLGFDALIHRLLSARRCSSKSIGVVKIGALYSAAITLTLLTIARNEDYRTPEIMYRDVVAKNPRSHRAHQSLGALRLKEKDAAEAIAEYGEAVRLEPGNYFAHAGLGIARRIAGDLNGSIAACQEAIRLNPKYAQAYLELATTLHHGRRFDAAILVLHDAIRIEPNLAALHLALGEALQANGDIDKAIAEFRTVIEREPDNAAAHRSLGISLREKGALDAAVAECLDAIRLEPSNASAFKFLGDALRDKHEYDRSVGAYKDALKIEPGNASVQNDLGAVLEAKGDAKGALAAYNEAIHLDPENARAHCNKGKLLFTQGERNAGLASLREAVRRDPDLAPAQVTLGIAMMQMKDVESAMKAFHKAIQADPTYAEAHFHLGYALQQTNDVKGAIAAYQHAVQLRFRSPDAGISAAMLLKQRGEPAAALQVLQDAAQTKPGWMADVRTRFRFLSACCAALAGTGQGKDAPPEAARAVLRKRAHEWLAADLAAWRQIAAYPGNGAAVHQKMDEWLADSDLAALRDADRVNALPGDERREWASLWEGVRRLRGESSAPPKLK